MTSNSPGKCLHPCCTESRNLGHLCTSCHWPSLITRKTTYTYCCKNEGRTACVD
ncbi:hypothetical protein BDD12DRAFT_852540 [Trichophaea hybrida]|nr:hypothetical protein BDD12DRAFT_852540 [Trichophaea hybrida]